MPAQLKASNIGFWKCKNSIIQKVGNSVCGVGVSEKLCLTVEQRHSLTTFAGAQSKGIQCSEAARPAADRTSDSQSGQIKSLILEAAQSLGR